MKCSVGWEGAAAHAGTYPETVKGPVVEDCSPGEVATTGAGEGMGTDTF
ncbi:hypothetical protein HerbRD11066_63900 [Herbidospora sp. RD11066]